jgi:hypothetical protein
VIAAQTGKLISAFTNDFGPPALAARQRPCFATSLEYKTIAGVTSRRRYWPRAEFTWDT